MKNCSTMAAAAAAAGNRSHSGVRRRRKKKKDRGTCNLSMSAFHKKKKIRQQQQPPLSVWSRYHRRAIREKRVHHEKPTSRQLPPQSADLHRLLDLHMPQTHTCSPAKYVCVYMCVYVRARARYHSLLVYVIHPMLV